MSGNDDWQRDQWDRERGANGIVTGSAANQQALADRDAHQRLTQTIQDNLNKASAPSTTFQNRAQPAIPPLFDSGPGIRTEPGPISSTAVILSIAAVLAVVVFLVTGDLISSAIAAGTASCTLFGVRAFFRSRLFDRTVKVVATVFVIGIIGFHAALYLSIFAAVIYLVWLKAGLGPALWTVGAVLAFAAFIAAIHWGRLRYQKFKATPRGKRFSRNVGRVHLLLTLCVCGAGLWWLSNAIG